MALFKDRSGQLWEFDNADDATRQGMVEASDADVEAHNHSIDVEQAGDGTTIQSALEGAARAAMAPGMAITEAITGERPGQTPQDQLPIDQRSALSESVEGPEARLRREAHPLAAGAGGGAVAALAGGTAALAAPAVVPMLGTSLGAIGTEAAVGALQQEYDDAWFEQRPVELQRVAANTLAFAGVDFLFRGALHGLTGLGTRAAKPGAIGGRNVVSEAQGAARELVEPVGGGSVGAARAADLEDEFHNAIAQMSDRDAAVLARDADAHLHLTAQDASESFTRLNDGLSNDLGNRLKYEDFAQYAAQFDERLLQRQAKWIDGVSEQAESAIQQLSGRTAGTDYALDFGNLGKKAAQTIDEFNRRVLAEADPGQRLQILDDYKKALDRLTMSVDASRSVDTVTRNELKGLIAPTRETLRKGLENPKLFGEAANLQRALNSPWHGLLEHWSKVQKALTEETGHVQFDVSGAGRITRESTVERMLAQLGKDPRSNQEFGRHLAGALDNIQGLIDARQAHGISRLDGLDALSSDIKNLMEDWNLAQTIGVAKNRSAALAKDPRKWATLALNIGERLPMVGQPIQLARTLGNAFTDLHIQKGTPLGKVWDSAYQRYALNPVFNDPSIIRNYPDWIAESLRNRGGSFTPPTGSAVPAPMVPGMPPANEGAVRGVAQPGLSATGQAAVDRARARIQQGGAVNLGGAPEDLLKERLSPATGATDGGMFRAADGVERYVKFMREPDALNEAATARAYADLGVEHVQHTTAPGGPEGHMVLSEKLGPEWRPLHMHNGPVTPRMARQFLAGVPADIVLGNVDRALNLGNVMTNGADIIRIDAGTAGPYVLGAPVMRHQTSVKGMWDELLEPVMSGESVGLSDGARALASEGGVKSLEAAQDALRDGVRRIESGLSAAGGSKAFVAERYPHLSVSEQREFAKQIDQRLKAVKSNVERISRRMAEAGFIVLDGQGPNFTLGGVAKSPMGVVTGAGAAGLGMNAALRDREPEPVPPSPAHAYRDALREVDQAGAQQARSLASEALRMKPPRGKARDPLALFAGKRSIQDAVEETRERLDEIGGDPTTLLQQLGASAGELRRTHPSVYMAAVEKAAQIGSYLQSVIPQRTATTLLDPRGAPVSFDRAWDYAARFVGATQPRAALREVARGSAPPEMVESLAQNWPEVWNDFRVEMLGQVQRMHAAGRHVPSEKLRRLDRLLGLGGQLDPTATPEVTQHMLTAQDAEAQRRQQQAQGGGQAPTGGSARAALRTPLAQINQERATG